MGAEGKIRHVLERSEGHLELSFKNTPYGTALDDLYQGGCLKARFPKISRSEKGGIPKPAILINTSGGLADGDRLTQKIQLKPNATAIITSQAAERVYKAHDLSTPATIDTAITIEEDASLYWLPQETILFNESSLKRHYALDISASGSCLAAETLVLGRLAMQEHLTKISLTDHWRIQFGDKLIFADGFHLGSNLQQQTEGAALLNGARALATVFYIGKDAEAYLEPVQKILANAASTAGVSCRKNILIARFLAKKPEAVRADLSATISTIDHIKNPATGGVTSPITSRWIF
ncbi:MAG: urease accessory protein UreD [Kordiimonadaceae bacterium]|nr:urease accessory protein UreD [Kordiimonadaceae bacterium]